MRIDSDTKLWLVTDPTEHSELADVLCEVTLARLRLQFAGGLTMDQHPTVFTDQEEAREDAMNRLLCWKVARQIRVQRRLPADEVVRITLHDRDGKVLWQGEVR